MDQRTTQMFFSLLRSAICGTMLTEQEKKKYSFDILEDLLVLSSQQDVVHLLVLGLKRNNLISKENIGIENYMFKAIYRYEQISYEYEKLCNAFEEVCIPFLPLKGSVIRKYYPEEWMRTSCDIDILVRPEDLDRAIIYMSQKLHYIKKERATHDVSLFSPMGIHVELHFDLVEEERANNAISVLDTVWENVILGNNCKYRYELNDAFFYFYHIAHMAKHFENGGCGIRPFIDLWILDHLDTADKEARDNLLIRGELARFANVCRVLSEVWFGDREIDGLSAQVQEYLLKGGLYGSSDNRVALQQQKKGGRVGYLFSRIFISYEKLRRYYPVLNKYRWLMPIMQIRRWFMMLNPNVAKLAKRELIVNGKIRKSKARDMNIFLDRIGLK